ncbi:MAG TPA: lysophospholipid acyltransferase family protein [Gammaproteobacteria bacterium]|nr:lysophospholipid acyltransferase family protein [Gammaproteobacteria bacterium]
MLAKLYMWWRALGTGLCFAGFGICSLIATLTVLPVILLWPATPATRQRRIRVFISYAFRALLAAIATLRLGWVDVEGREWLAQAQGKLVVATHPMYLDVVALISLLPAADCVVKSKMLRNPFTRFFAKAAGYISNEDSVSLVDACINSMQSGRTLIVFPQGTRSIPGEPLRFKRGVAQVALRSHCKIMPVMIHCSPPALLKNTPWYQVPDRPWRLLIKAYPPQTLAALGHCDDLPYGVAARHLTQTLENFFNQQLTNHEYANPRTETAHHRFA